MVVEKDNDRLVRQQMTPFCLMNARSLLLLMLLSLLRTIVIMIVERELTHQEEFVQYGNGKRSFNLQQVSNFSL